MAVTTAEEDQVPGLGIKGRGLHGSGETMPLPLYIQWDLPAQRSFSGWAGNPGGLPGYSRLTLKKRTEAPAGITSA